MRSARIYLLDGELSAEDLEAIKKYVINPVEAREASLDTRDTLKMEFAVPTAVETLNGFCALDDAALENFRNEKGLAMDHADIVFCQNSRLTTKLCRLHLTVTWPCVPRPAAIKRTAP